MKSHVRVAVIGGGIIGCNVLYHLTKLGCTDVALIEKGELTSGSTWHAAGQVGHMAPLPLLSRIQKEGLESYVAVEQETGESSGVHLCGGLMLAHSKEEIEEFKRFLGIARTLGIAADIVGPQQARALWPLLETNSIVGALHTPDEGYADPAQTTNNLARAARMKGAEIYRRTRVTGLARTESGEWRIETDQGTIAAEHVVNCAGAWAAEISAMLGHYLPVLAFEHQYLITEDFDELHNLQSELPVLRDLNVPMYLRQERTGLMVGCFEDRTYFWGLDGLPRDFDTQLLPPDVERCAPQLERTAEMVPVLNRLGIRRVVNGPTPRSPDHLPLLGPAHGERGYWVFAGIRGGFVQGGAARYLAEWIVEGEPSIDVSLFDVRRFGPYGTKAYAVDRLAANHAFSSPVNYPYVESGAGRPARTGALYAALKERGAVFGVRNGWEVANWFAVPGEKAADEGTFGRPHWHGAVARECTLTREAAGLADLSASAKIEIAGPDAAALLRSVSAAPLPEGDGGAAPAVLINGKGGVASLGFVLRLGPQRFLLVSQPECEQRDEIELAARAAGRDARVANLTGSHGLFWLGGPKATAILEQADGHSLAAVGAMGSAAVSAGIAEARAWRIDDLAAPAWLLLHRAEAQLALFRELERAGTGHGLGLVGQRALESLRMERCRPRWGADIAGDSVPAEAGLAAGQAERRLALLAIDADGIGVWGGEPVMHGGRDVAVVTSGGFGHALGKPIALARLPAELAAPGTELSVEMFGEPHRAVVTAPAA